MKRGRQLKSKLRQYSSNPSTNDSTAEPTTTSTSSVTEKIAKLRIEQSRAVANRQRRHNGPFTFEGEHSHQVPTTIHSDGPWLPLWTGLVAPANESSSSHSPSTRRPTRPAAGPPPPPSWTRIRPSRQQKLSSSTRLHSLQQHRSLLEQQHGMVSSLVRICCQRLAELHANADTLDSSSRWIYQMKLLPGHIKQRILYEWSFIGGEEDTIMASTINDLRPSEAMVTDTNMDLFFQKTEYEELWLEASHLSLERLIQGFWKVTPITTTTTTTAPVVSATNFDQLVDDWEDLLEDDTTTIHDHDDNDDPSLPTFILHMDQQEEIGKWSHIYRVMKFLRSDIDNSCRVPGTPSSYALSSPFLGRTLVSLNLSFMTLSSKSDSPFSWVTFAYLMVSTLPHLMWLYTAGCFDGGDVVQGTRVLSILSHGLRKLKFWDLCYYDWLQLDLLTSVVDWRRDLLELKTLCLSSSSGSSLPGTEHANNQKAIEISRWFKDNHLSRISIIWIDG
ncbi:unnamed protein product [Absidia cylindrospora]